MGDKGLFGMPHPEKIYLSFWTVRFWEVELFGVGLKGTNRKVGILMGDPLRQTHSLACPLASDFSWAPLSLTFAEVSQRSKSRS